MEFNIDSYNISQKRKMKVVFETRRFFYEKNITEK